MAMARACDACGDELKGGRFMEVHMRLLQTSESQELGQLEGHYGAYCPACIKNGAAIQDLVGRFTKYPQPGLKQRIKARA